MVTLTFGILKTFFDLSCPEARIPHTLLSDNAYLFNQAQGSFNAYYELVGDWVFTYKGSKCALNPDGSLKDAKDIVFYNDPDDAVPISAPSSSAQPPTDAFSVLLQTGHKPVPLTAGARRSIRTSKPSARLRDSDNACSSTSRKRALSSATEQLVRKKVVLQLSAPLSDDDTDIDTDHGAGQSDEAEDEDVPAPEDEPEDEPEDLQDTTIRAALSKSERSADIRTIFTRDDKHSLFDDYYTPPSRTPTTNEQSAPPTRAASVRKHYGDDWMCEAIRTRKTSDHLTHNPRQELNMYLSSPLEETDDIVAWWGLHSLQYPTLARIARDYLPIQGSSVPSEQAFSSGGITSTIRRNALVTDTFTALQLLKGAYRNGHLSAGVEAEGHAASLDICSQPHPTALTAPPSSVHLAHTTLNLSLAWTPDGTRLLTCGDREDPTIHEWDTTTWKQVGDPWTGHINRINSIVIHPAGKLVASASSDNHVRFWQLSDRRTIAIFEHSFDTLCTIAATTACDACIDGDLSTDEELLMQDINTDANNHIPYILAITTSHIACVNGDLSTAEGLLTQDINTSLNDHTFYAHWSFVMARKCDWDRALLDAIKSIRIQPSLMGYISKGIALCGKGCILDARAAFDVASMYMDQDSEIVHFLLLIKAITLFQHGSRRQHIP
ncbi:uncharacterized protein HD556DRAFT_1437268 [Suillus plorans]|uniref:HAT C-terminal dimerisation domain-containing protein n=1 Tax=Suillus plorans TaxID=116603 RepID=A0A9P7J681_9AGAM|nr:uncharacterized protein HD556DRAFT_1437268 [Suillus plorans]KAG1805105.1 hypothetical protein HD556DRAFT_1437268 [Suillus plorans]